MGCSVFAISLGRMTCLRLRGARGGGERVWRNGDQGLLRASSPVLVLVVRVLLLEETEWRGVHERHGDLAPRPRRETMGRSSTTSTARTAVTFARVASRQHTSHATTPATRGLHPPERTEYSIIAASLVSICSAMAATRLWGLTGRERRSENGERERVWVGSEYRGVRVLVCVHR